MTCSPYAIACQEWPDLNLLALTGKRPVEKNWSRWCSQPQAPGYRHGWAKSSDAYNVGVALGFNGLVAIDIDTDDLHSSAQSSRCCPQYGQRSVVGGGSRHSFETRRATLRRPA